MAHKKKGYWAILVILLVATGVGSYFLWSFLSEGGVDLGVDDDQNEVLVDDNEDENENSNIENTAVEEGKEDELEKKVIQYEGEDPNEAETLSGAIIYSTVNNSKLTIGVNIDQYLTDGKCELTLSRGGASIYSSIAKIIGDVSTSTCDGFEVPVTELGGGAVEINIKLSSGERSGSIRGEVDI